MDSIDLPRDRVVRVPHKLRYPTRAYFSQFIAKEQELLDRLSGAPTTLATIRVLSAGWLSDAPEIAELRTFFWDDLGTYLPSPTDWSVEQLASKAIHEFMLTYPLHAKSSRAWADLPAGLEDLHRVVSGRDEPLRGQSVCVLPDQDGNSVLFPPAENVPILLNEMGAFVNEFGDQNPILAATACYVGLMHAHPFDDGNGRLGRALFNLIINASHSSFHYVPLQLLYHFQQGDFLIKLRRAMYGSDWTGIYQLFVASIKASLYFQGKSSI